MYETVRTDSPWAGYLQSLPRREYLPIFWTDEELALMQGTGVAEKARADRELTQEDFESGILPVLQRHRRRLPVRQLTLDGFRVAASWVASRAFGVDQHHGMAMVPMADIFNHKAAVVDLSEGYAVEDACDGSADPSGSEQSLESGSADSEAESDACSQPSSSEARNDPQALPSQASALLPEAARPSKRARIARQPLEGGPAVDPSLRLEIGICSVSEGGEDLLQIVAASDVACNKEVHNTYGELGNTELVNKYGFALRQNPFSVVELNKAALLVAAKQELGAKAWKARCKMLEEESELLQEDAEPFEVLPGGVMGPALLVALRVLFAPQHVWTTWTSLADALQVQPVGQLGRPTQAEAAARQTTADVDGDLGSVPIATADAAALTTWMAALTLVSSEKDLINQALSALALRDKGQTA
ncbi:hypothetical protein WJX72_010928 [[Myrmecia] bisecta]|uniref:SET domain-containing protein n=1 Tax=[Myrmecia] bisecta TaxID=41462 RepID=A0AAW1PQB0_9CHLO